jgi:site-specific recombinase XerD
LDVEKKRTLLEVYEDHNKEFELLVDKGLSYRTLQKYKTIKGYLVEFFRYQYALNDIELHSVDYQFIRDFEIYLKSVKHCCHNTAMDYLKKIKKILNQCIAKKWIGQSPFVGFKMSNHETHKTFLTEVELKLISEKKIAIARLDQVRDMFLFSCYTGLAYCDVEKLTSSNIVIGVDGDRWISTNRSKTNTASNIPLLPVACTIVDKYSNHPSVAFSGRLLPIMSNQRMNSYLKELADLCGIPKDLTFHCARHTFATTVTLTNGVPIETVSNMLGHKSLKTTQHYAKIVDKKVSEDMRVLKEKYSSPIVGC